MRIETHALIGRDTEIAALNELVASARQGRSVVLVLEGEPGVGKTALLKNVVARASGFRLLWAQGLESEVELPYGGLGQLLRPIRDSAAKLGSGEADLLRTVFATTGPQPQGPRIDRIPEPFAVAVAALALLAEAAEDRTLLAVIDDAHWVDQPSIDALAFIAHRLLAEGILLLFSTRSGTTAAATDKLPRLTVRGLDPAAATQLLGTVGLNPERVQHLVSVSNGNPLALLELPRLLSEEQLSGALPSRHPLPIGDELMKAYSASFKRLAPESRRAVLVSAILDEPDAPSVERALAAASLSMADLEEAEDADLVTVDASGVSFRHPFLRSAATYSAPPSWRRKAHAAVAASLEGSTGTHRQLARAWHSAAAATSPDEQTASMLENAADEAFRLAGFRAAASAYERAALLSPSNADRHTRTVAAADASFTAGRIAKADELLLLARSLPDRTPGSELAAARIKSRVDLALGALPESLAGAVFTAEAMAPSRPVEAASLLIPALGTAMILGDTQRARQLAEQACALSATDPMAGAIARTALGVVLLLRGESVEGLELVTPIVEHLEHIVAGNPAILQAAPRVADAIAVTDEFARAQTVASVLLPHVIDGGALTVLPILLRCESLIAWRRGQWQSADVAAHRALDLAREVDHQDEAGLALAQLAGIAAGYGKESDCRQAVADALDISERTGDVVTAALTLAALGLLELRLRKLAASSAALQRCQQICEKAGFLELGHFQWAPELAEVHVRAGDIASALEITDLIEWHAARTGRPIIRAFAARCRGFAASDYDVPFRDALEWHSQAERPFELARTQLCYGERLRRDKQRAAARVQLNEAWRAFQTLGAMDWAEHARTELAAVGVYVQAQAADARRALLTPQELQVAGAVVGGATNREVATQLFLSPKTVEYHLGRIFRKFGVTSRAGLTAVLAPEN